jgi:HEAT repeat protein
VTSLGQLKLPSAIGALLDMARRHPEMPQALLSKALNACSVDCLDIDGVSTPEMRALTGAHGDLFNGEIHQFDAPAPVEELPDATDEERYAEAISKVNDENSDVRCEAARSLSMFHVKSAVDALSQMISNDPEPQVRAAAAASLAAFDHESVLPIILTALADDSREVVAAAARGLSRFSFDRADAYVRLHEMSDREILAKIARACIKSGMASQAIERLSSTDRRQAYEAFALLAILAKAGEIEPLFVAIQMHEDTTVRIAAVHVIGLAGEAEVSSHLRQLAAAEGIPESVRNTIMEVLAKILSPDLSQVSNALGSL